jgi:hypothetical protein
LNRLSNRRGVDDGEQLLEMLHHDGVEEDDVLVAEGGEEGVLGEGGGTFLQLLVGALALLVEGVDFMRKETEKAEGVALFASETGTLEEENG